ncbi:MAG: serine/threonine-protein phosphatase [Deltaproteobacteria bacterium]|nr:MAG: serine/threonine-protein phosphatase [Deltaproteobacteria bacterium]
MGIEIDSKSWYNNQKDEVNELSFLSGKLFHYSMGAPGYDINQDSSAYVNIDNKTGFLMVADGMGGHEKGELASKTALSTLASQLKKNYETKPVCEIILDSIEKINEKITKSEEMGGTTLTVCEFGKNYVRFFNIGDSFGLVMNEKGHYRFRTIDDSITGYGVESGLITEEKALVHEESNVITNALGFGDYRVEVSCKQKVDKGDIILISTDGLSANLTTEVITGAISSGDSENRLSSLVNLARTQMMDENAKIRNLDDLTCFLFVIN